MFKQAHRTGRNKTLLIAQMEDEHLLKMIGAVVSWAERATRQFHTFLAQAEVRERADASGRLMIAEVQRQMYGLPDPPTVREAAARYAHGMNTLSGRLEPYLLEAWTRDLSEADQAVLDGLRARWRKAVGRSAALPGAERVLLAAPVVPDQYDEDENALPF